MHVDYRYVNEEERRVAEDEYDFTEKPQHFEEREKEGEESLAEFYLLNKILSPNIHKFHFRI